MEPAFGDICARSPGIELFSYGGPTSSSGPTYRLVPNHRPIHNGGNLLGGALRSTWYYGCGTYNRTTLDGWTDDH